MNSEQLHQSEQLPDFLIVGAMKSGTSTLADYLRLHESIRMPEEELHFFDRREEWKRGPTWYAERLRNAVGPEYGAFSLLGEKTPTYSYQPECAGRIAEMLPEVRLIWIFREPARRTYSNYLHSRAVGGEILSFRSAVRREAPRARSNIFKGYVERSKYVNQVERFLEYFPLPQMHFLLFENLLRSPLSELNRVARFLGVPPFESDPPEIRSNPARYPRWPLSLWLARRIAGRHSRLFEIVTGVNTRPPRRPPPIPPDVEKHLRKTFAPYNQKLAELTGLDLSLWE